MPGDPDAAAAPSQSSRTGWATPPRVCSAESAATAGPGPGHTLGGCRDTLGHPCCPPWGPGTARPGHSTQGSQPGRLREGLGWLRGHTCLCHPCVTPVSPASSLAVLWEQTQPIPAVLNPRGARVDGRRQRLFQPVWISHPERASRNPSQRRELPDYLCCCESGLGSSLVLPAWRQGIVISGGRGRQVLPKSLHFPAPVLLSRIEGTPGTPSAHPQGCREMSPGANQPALPQEGSPLPH